ncbi:MAG: hypothetical protein U9Q69_06145 [Nanoarchaeota archaeon]|nr:hypothetical protein [Nanoarchaeota archaeon]
MCGVCHVEARYKRKKASYSTKINFEKIEVELLRLKAISFVNKVKEIIENSNSDEQTKGLDN